MKKPKQKLTDDLRPYYKRSDFSGPMIRGKYAQRLKESSNIVVLTPEVAAAFPDSEAVNAALMSLIKIAQSSTGQRTQATRQSKGN